MAQRHAATRWAIGIMGAGAIGAIAALSLTWGRNPASSSPGTPIVPVMNTELPAAELPHTAERPPEELPAGDGPPDAPVRDPAAESWFSNLPAPRDADALEAALHPAHLRGLVLRDSVPAADVKVGLQWQRIETVGGLLPWYGAVVTDANGRFETDLDPFAEYFVTVDLDDEQSEPVPPLETAPGSQHEVTLNLVPPSSVSGVVLDARGNPADQVRVYVWQDTADPAARKTGVVTGSRGEFAYALPRDVSGTLIAVTEGAMSDLVVVQLSNAKPRMTITLRLIDAADITGRVLRNDGTPVAGVLLHAEPIDPGGAGLPGSPTPADRFGESAASTNEYGAYSLTSLHPGGRFEVRCFGADAGLADDVAHDVGAGQRNVDFLLAPEQP